MNSVWMNRGSLIASEALDDRGFRFGHRVMTTMMIIDGFIIDFDRHMQRLEAHAEVAGLSAGFRSDIIKFEIEGILQAKPMSRVACRIYLTPGRGGLRAPIQDVEKWIHVEEYQPSSDNAALKLQMISASQWSRGARIKTGIYGELMPTVMRAHSQGFDDVLWCNSEQEIAECTTANIFLIGREGDLVEIATPPESSGLLAGVTRRRIMELLNAAKIPVTERIIYKDELARFDEAFVTSSLAGLVPVQEINGHKLHSARPKAVFGHIQRLWTSWLGTVTSP